MNFLNEVNTVYDLDKASRKYFLYTVEKFFETFETMADNNSSMTSIMQAVVDMTMYQEELVNLVGVYKIYHPELNFMLHKLIMNDITLGEKLDEEIKIDNAFVKFLGIKMKDKQYKELVRLSKRRKRNIKLQDVEVIKEKKKGE